MIKTIIAQQNFSLFMSIGKLISLKMNKLFFLALVLLLSSCYSSKKLDYLQSKEQFFVLSLHEKEEYKVQPSDVLNIRVQSRIQNNLLFLI